MSTSADDRILDDPEAAAAAVVHDEPRPRRWTDSLREVRNWKELRRTPYGLRPLWLIVWIGLFVSLNSVVGDVALKEIVRSIHMDGPNFIRYGQFVSFVGVLASLGIAQFADRHRRVPMVAVGIFFAGLLTALTAPARSGLSYGVPDVTALIALIIAFVPVSSLLADYYPPEVRGKVYAILGIASAIPETIIPKIAGTLVDHYGWRVVYLTAALPMLALGVLCLVRLREPVRGYMERKALGVSEEVALVAEDPVSFAEAWRTLWGIRTLRRIFLANAIGIAGLGILPRTRAAFLFEHYHLSAGGYGTVIAVSGAIVLPAYLLAGPIADDLLKRRPSMVLSGYGVLQLLAVIPLTALILAPPLIFIVLSIGLFAFILSLTDAAINALLVQVTPAHVRSLGWSVNRLAGLASIIGGIFVGSLLTSYGYRGTFLFMMPFAIVSAVIYISAGPQFELDMRSALAANLAGEEWRRAKASGKGKLLVCRDVDVAYDGVQVLFGVDFDVEEGEIIALLGTNGAGKSTLLRAISGTQIASSGGIIYDGRDITYMPPNESAARGIIFMPGGRGIFPGLSVRENLLLGSWMTEDESDVRERLEEVFRIFPVLAERADNQAGDLSGGEQQQLSLAQAFLCKPRLLMIDELSLGLSPAIVGELIEIVRRIHETGVTIIVVEQSVNVALTIAKRAIFMEKGEVKFVGPTSDLLARPDILRAVYVKGTAGSVTAGPSRQRQQQLDEAPTVLEVDQVTKRFGGITALDSVDLTVVEGQVLGLIGPNGSGKTTLFDIISGYQQADSGRIRYEGIDITDLSPDQRAARRLIRRFQDARLFPSLTVYETLLVALDHRLESRNLFGHALALPNARRSERRVRVAAERLIELLDLGANRDKFVRELSTGLRRIVDLACVLANDPKLLLLDEPSSGIAQAEAEGLAPLLRRVRFETGCSILIIEHDMPLISAVADELVALDRGAVVVRGSADTVLNNEQVIESYLGGSEESVRRSGSLV